MSMFPRIPRPEDPISPNWGRQVVEALRALRPSGGPGMRVQTGAEGTSFAMAPAHLPRRSTTIVTDVRYDPDLKQLQKKTVQALVIAVAKKNEGDWEMIEGGQLASIADELCDQEEE